MWPLCRWTLGTEGAGPRSLKQKGERQDLSPLPASHTHPSPPAQPGLLSHGRGQSPAAPQLTPGTGSDGDGFRRVPAGEVLLQRTCSAADSWVTGFCTPLCELGACELRLETPRAGSELVLLSRIRPLSPSEGHPPPPLSPWALSSSLRAESQLLTHERPTWPSGLAHACEPVSLEAEAGGHQVGTQTGQFSSRSS